MLKKLCLGFAATALVVLSGCASQKAPVATTAVAGQTPVILISIDGFRADYLDRGMSPTLKALADGGANAAMRPSFPSITFPNHYALVTGKRPDTNGIVENTMRDPARPGVVFKMSAKDQVVDRFWWDEATPFWVTAERAGVKTGTMFWPGSEAAIQGVRPSYYLPFDHDMPSNARADQILAWMDLPEAQRPRAYTLYFDIVDTAGHDYGPDSPEVNQAIATVDAAIAHLLEGLKARGQNGKVDLVIVADHGMAAISKDRTLFVEDWLPAEAYDYYAYGVLLSLNPQPGHEAEVDKALIETPHDHMQCWHKGQLPARWHYGTNPRIPAIVCSPEVGWLIAITHAKGTGYKGGAHGFDNYAPEMQALFIANGPTIKPAVKLDTFDNVDVYDLVMKLIGLPPESNDGTLEPLKPALKN